MGLCEFYENDADEFIPHVWLGNFKSSNDEVFLQKNNIKIIVRVMQEDYPTKKIICTKFGYIYQDKNKRIIYSIPYHDIQTCELNITNLLLDACDFMSMALDSKIGNILIHCKRGHHRSAAVAVAFLTKKYLIKYDEAIKYINSIRKCALRRSTCMVKGLYDFYLKYNKIKCDNL